MNCADWQERVALHAGGDPAEGVEAHLAACARCAAFHAEMREALESLRGLRGEEIGAAHYTAVRARVMAELTGSRRRWRGLAWLAGATAMAAAAMMTWPGKQAPVPEPPRMMATIPSAPLVAMEKRAVTVKVRTAKREPITVRLQTSDPNIVIYWIAD